MMFYIYYPLVEWRVKRDTSVLDHDLDSVSQNPLTHTFVVTWPQIFLHAFFFSWSHTVHLYSPVKCPWCSPAMPYQSLALCVSLCLSLCISLHLFLCLTLPVTLRLTLPVTLRLSLTFTSPLTVSHSLSHSACHCVSLCLTLPLTLRSTCRWPDFPLTLKAFALCCKLRLRPYQCIIWLSLLLLFPFHRELNKWFIKAKDEMNININIEMKLKADTGKTLHIRKLYKHQCCAHMSTGYAHLAQTQCALA